MNTGIYIILNTLNNKCYIGASYNTTRRINDHRSMLNKGKHFSKELQEDWGTLGEESFMFGILEKLQSPPKEALIEREKHWVVVYKQKPDYTVYNTNDGGYNKTQGTREKLRLANLGDKNPKYWLGKKRSAETCKKISEANKGKMSGEKHFMWGKEGYWKGKEKPREGVLQAAEKNKGQKRTVDARKKMSAAKVGKDPHNKFPITDEVLEDIKGGISYAAFTEKYGMSKNTIKRIKKELKGEKRVRIRDPQIREA